MPSKKIGSLTCDHVIETLDTGQSILHVTATNGDVSYCHRVTIGAVDGNDALTSLSPVDLQDHLQKVLDDARATAANILQARLNVTAALQNLN